MKLSSVFVVAKFAFFVESVAQWQWALNVENQRRKKVGNN